MFSQVTENSSNTHILVERFEFTVCQLKGSNFSTQPFPEANLFCDQHFNNTLMITYSAVHIHLNCSRKTVIRETGL